MSKTTVTPASNIVKTTAPPYYVVIFTSRRSEGFEENKEYVEEYSITIKEMLDLAAKQPGYLGVERAREQIGITCSYWKDYESIIAWRNNSRHQIAQKKGRAFWYSEFITRVGIVEREDQEGVFLPS